MDPVTPRGVSHNDFSWRDVRLSNEVSGKTPCQQKRGRTGKPFGLAMRCDCLPQGSEQSASLSEKYLIIIIIICSICTQRSSQL